jgi:SpoVK/Ycf46/Vps4 family AAA+-type ATPase
MESLDKIITRYQKLPTLHYSELCYLLHTCDKDFQERKFNDPSFSGNDQYQPMLYYPSSIFQQTNTFVPIFTPVHVPLVPPPPMLKHESQKTFQDNIPSLKIPEKVPLSIIRKKDICVSIDTFQDLLILLEKHPYEPKYEYNIDLQALHKIKTELHALNEMVGLKKFKEEILDQLLYFAQRLHVGKNSDFMHTVLCGPPGTGKTEVAIILGKMYSKLGILKNQVFKKVCRNDLVAGYLGQTALKTKKVIDECLGGCLFIDEAYALANDYNGDSYSKECIDVLCEALSAHKEDLMVIIAGYKDNLENTFFQANKGMKSRFIWKFELDHYNGKELVAIFEKKVRENNWNLGIDEKVFVSWMEKHKKVFVHYGRDMEQLFSYSKIVHGRRIYGNDEAQKKTILLEDLEKGLAKFRENNVQNERRPPMGMYL